MRVRTFRPGRRTYHKISVKLKRPGLKVRTRTGFYGVSDEKAVPAPRTREAQLNAAVTSPFGANGVHLRLTSFFGNDAKVGSFIRSLLHIDARDLTFVKQPDGTHQAVFDVLAYTFGDNGQPIDNVGRTYTLTVKEKLETLRRDGFVYTLTVPLKKAGAYQLRVALRDTATERVGAASQFVEVPNFNKNRLALSSLALSNDDSQTPENAAKGADEARDPQTTVALRRFQAGQAISYGYWIYNAKPDKATQRPQLTSQARIFYEGKEIYAGPLHPYDIVATGANPDLRRIVNGGRLQHGTKMNPGEYILQVIVTDLLTSGKNRTTSQWIDFEIIK